jgi:hypothetical protein
MKCDDALDAVYETEDALPLRKRLGLAFHIIGCGRCAARLETYETARSLLRTSFFPPSPDFCGAIMDSIYSETRDEEDAGPVFGAGGFSTKGWVIAGIALLISLVTAFFQQYQDAAFLLSLGIITGVVITGYGALFIGSHLKELSHRFKL